MAKQKITTEILQSRVDGLQEAGYKLVSGKYNAEKLATYLVAYDEAPRKGRYHPAPHSEAVSFFNKDNGVYVHLIVKAPKSLSIYNATLYQVLITPSSSSHGDRDHRTTAMNDIKKVIAKANELGAELREQAEIKARHDAKNLEEGPKAIAKLKEIFGDTADIRMADPRHNQDTTSSILVTYRGYKMETYTSTVLSDNPDAGSVKIEIGAGKDFGIYNKDPLAYNAIPSYISLRKAKKVIDAIYAVLEI